MGALKKWLTIYFRKILTSLLMKNEKNYQNINFFFPSKFSEMKH